MRALAKAPSVGQIMRGASPARAALLALAFATFLALAFVPLAQAAPTRAELPDLSKPAASGTGDLTGGSNVVTNVNTASGAFEIGQTIVGEKIPLTPTLTRITAVGAGTLELSANAEETKSGVTLRAGINAPCGAGTDSNGYLYLAEYNAGFGSRVRIYDAAEPRQLVTEFAVEGCNLAVDASGNVYLVHPTSGSVKRYAPSAPLPVTGATTYSLDTSLKSSGTLVASGAKAVALHPASGNVYVSEAGVNEVQIFSRPNTTACGGTGTKFRLRYQGVVKGELACGTGSSGLTVAEVQAVINELFGAGNAIATGNLGTKTVTFAESLARTDVVDAIEVIKADEAQTLISTATESTKGRASRISSYQPDGTLISNTIGSGVSGASYVGIGVYGANGRVYAVDGAQGKAYVFNSAGDTVLATITGAEAPGGPFAEMSEAMLAVDQSNGNVLISDIKAHGAVDEFNAAGKYVAQLTHAPSPLSAPLSSASLAVPAAVAYDNSVTARKGNVYLTSGSNLALSTGTAGALYAYGPASPSKTLATSVPGGSGSVKCNGTTCAASYSEESSISLEAIPAVGFALKEWKGGTGSAATCNGSSSPTCTITLSQNSSIEAEFALAGFKLSVTKNGTGEGKVTSAPAGIDCGSDCEETFAENTPVTLSATPEPGSTFKGWAGDDCAGTGSCEVTMSAAKNVSATFAAAPTVVTTPGATNIVPKAAEVAGSVDPNGSQIDPGSCKVEYGTDTNYTATPVSCSPTDPGAGTSPVAVSASLTGLAPNTTYHFRFVATNEGGTGQGQDQTFTTAPLLSPEVTTKAATSIGKTAATLNGSVNPKLEAVTDCKFEYEAVPVALPYDSTAPCTPSPGSGNSAVDVSAAISGLSADTSYQFRLVATNGGGTTNGSDLTFKTAADEKPAVSSLSPNQGPATGGTQVTITGVNFTGASEVKFGSTNATSFSVESATQIKATAPAGTGTVGVSVTTAEGTSADTAADDFTYVAAPAVSSLSPTQGPAAGGTEVTITGTNLSGASAVKFGGANATSFTVESATQIKATSPAAAAGPVDVTVTTLGGTSANTAADDFTYVAAPSITGLSPNSGPPAGGNSVTITGTGLSGASAVKFGATNATGFTVDGPTQITATAPAGTGTVDVTVTTLGGTSANTAADNYSFGTPPALSSCTPSAGPLAGGTQVTITGTDLNGATAVKFGSTNATGFSVESATQVKATAPAGTGTVAITVTTPAGTSTVGPCPFTYTAAPTVSAISPTQGPVAGGTQVTITGTNLSGVSAVKFGSTNATSFTVESGTQIKATAPAGSAGTVDVTVTTAGGTSATGAQSKYAYVAQPTIASVSPAAGPTAGGTTVTINGTNLSAASFKFGSNSASGIVIGLGGTSATMIAPAGAAGTVDVTATTAGGTSATNPNAQYTYAEPPGVVTNAGATGISQSSATVSGSVDPNGIAVSKCEIEYGPTTSYGSKKSCESLPGSGADPVPVGATLTGLSANTTYHFRFIATGPGGTATGQDQVFTTLAHTCATDSAACPPKVDPEVPQDHSGPPAPIAAPTPAKKAPKCRKGFKRRQVKGKARCVKTKKKAKKAHKGRRAR